ncbi:MAG TPA: hypothetical protein VMF65_16405 [Acidimicrobiales bacterium]|nr:hypothetical protein [Acidimicrobiales bacterium]
MALAPMALVDFFDSVNVQAIPADARVVAGYVDGRYATVPALVQRFPGAVIIRITVTGMAGVEVCDCETGDLTPAQAAAWADAEVQAGRRPTIYCSASSRPAVVTALMPYGMEFVRDVDNWVADYDGVAQVPAGSVAKQYQTNSYDSNVALSTWSVLPQPVPQPPPELIEEMNMVAWDPVTGGYWMVNPDGAVYSVAASGGATPPYLGGLNNHPAYKAGGKAQNGPCVGIAPFGPGGQGGYVLVTFDGTTLHPYTFPRDGSLANA